MKIAVIELRNLGNVTVTSYNDKEVTIINDAMYINSLDKDESLFENNYKLLVNVKVHVLSNESLTFTGVLAGETVRGILFFEKPKSISNGKYQYNIGAYTIECYKVGNGSNYNIMGHIIFEKKALVGRSFREDAMLQDIIFWGIQELLKDNLI